jgi:hypothetical protein
MIDLTQCSDELHLRRIHFHHLFAHCANFGCPNSGARDPVRLWYSRANDTFSNIEFTTNATTIRITAHAARSIKYVQFIFLYHVASLRCACVRPSSGPLEASVCPGRSRESQPSLSTAFMMNAAAIMIAADPATVTKYIPTPRRYGFICMNVATST